MKNQEKFNWRQLRKKENKTKEDEILLEFRDSITIISETLVDNSKMHISDKECIEEIREILTKIENI